MWKRFKQLCEVFKGNVSLPTLKSVDEWRISIFLGSYLMILWFSCRQRGNYSFNCVNFRYFFLGRNLIKKSGKESWNRRKRSMISHLRGIFCFHEGQVEVNWSLNLWEDLLCEMWVHFSGRVFSFVSSRFANS